MSVSGKNSIQLSFHLDVPLLGKHFRDKFGNILANMLQIRVLHTKLLRVNFMNSRRDGSRTGKC